jgi:hypothetical protein
LGNKKLQEAKVIAWSVQDAKGAKGVKGA